MVQDRKTENMKLDPSVIDTIVSITASEVDGVASVGGNAPAGFFAKLAKKPTTAGIDCKVNDDGKLEIALHVDVYFGHVIPDLAEELRTSIADALLVQAGREVAKVDIFVDGIQFKQS